MSPGRPVGGREVPPSGRVLAVDIGDVRVGLAASDPDQTIASPDETLPVQSPEDLDLLADRVAEAADGRGAVGIVVGYPRTLEGREGSAARRARELAELLADRDEDRAVVLWDERFTTAEAERMMLEQDASRGERKQASDRVAASLILQGWLEARRRQTG